MAAMPSAYPVEGTSEIFNWIVTAAAANRRGNMRRLLLPLYRTITGVGCAMGFAYWEPVFSDCHPERSERISTHHNVIGRFCACDSE